MEEQTPYQLSRNRFGAYITICTNDRVYCLPLTETQINQIHLIGGDFVEQLKEVFQCSAPNAEKK